MIKTIATVLLCWILVYCADVPEIGIDKVLIGLGSAVLVEVTYISYLLIRLKK